MDQSGADFVCNHCGALTHVVTGIDADVDIDSRVHQSNINEANGHTAALPSLSAPDCATMVDSSTVPASADNVPSLVAPDCATTVDSSTLPADADNVPSLVAPDCATMVDSSTVLASADNVPSLVAPDTATMVDSSTVPADADNELASSTWTDNTQVRVSTVFN